MLNIPPCSNSLDQLAALLMVQFDILFQDSGDAGSGLATCSDAGSEQRWSCRFEDDCRLNRRRQVFSTRGPRMHLLQCWVSMVLAALQVVVHGTPDVRNQRPSCHAAAHSRQ